MTVTYIVRHGRTPASAAYIASGDPSRPVRLDAEGTRQCLRHAGSAWTSQIVTCIASEFPRAIQTAQLLMSGRRFDLLIDPRLNEINYGLFEGGPWLTYGGWLAEHGPDAAPAGGESRTGAIERMLDGLAACLTLPGPRLVVGHGLMVAALLHLVGGGQAGQINLPEAPYVEPATFTDTCLARLIGGRPNNAQRSSTCALA